MEWELEARIELGSSWLRRIAGAATGTACTRPVGTGATLLTPGPASVPPCTQASPEWWL